jgi:hypothetical protein
MHALLLVVLAFACERSPAPSNQADPALVALVSSDPAAAATRIDAAPDPLARTALLVALSDAGAAFSPALCEALQPGSTKERCVVIVKRPHLTGNPAVGERDVDRPAPGPATTFVVPLKSVRSKYADVPAVPADCADSVPLECRQSLAKERLNEGDVTGAVGLCVGVPEERWRTECLFHLAEYAADQRTPESQGTMAELCLMSGEYVVRCYDHGARRLSGRTPPADSSPDKWLPVIALADAITASWADRDPVFGAFQVDRFWSYALLRSVNLQPIPTGSALDAIPPEAVRHLRSAVALRVLQDVVPEDAALLQAEEALAVGLEARIEPQPWDAARPASGHPPPRWARDQGPDSDVPATFHFGSGRRTYSEDPVVDGAIALVEAAAVLDPPRRRILEDSRADPRGQVAWTATRLLQWLDRDTDHTYALDVPQPMDEVEDIPPGADRAPRGPPLDDDDPRVQSFKER